MGYIEVITHLLTIDPKFLGHPSTRFCPYLFISTSLGDSFQERYLIKRMFGRRYFQWLLFWEIRHLVSMWISMKKPGCLGFYKENEILPSYIGSINNHY